LLRRSLEMKAVFKHHNGSQFETCFGDNNKILILGGFAVFAPNNLTSKRFALAERSIVALVHFIPLHCQPHFREDYLTGIFDGGEAYYKKMLKLLMY